MFSGFYNGLPRRTSVASAVLCLGFILFPVLVNGGVIVAQDNWNLGDLENWSADNQSWVTVDNPGSGGIDNTGFLEITMTETSGNELDEYTAEVRTSASSLFAGTWETNMWIAFDFWAETDQPEYVRVMWGATNTRTWASTVFDSNDQAMPLASWTTLTSPLFMNYMDWGGWENQQTFLDDLAAIDWIGVYIYRGGLEEQMYGIDDFNLMVPEPSQYAMLTVALLAVWGTVRGTRWKNPSGG